MLWNSLDLEYDLVVIGATLEGILAANLAASFKVRVALVDLPHSRYFSSAEIIYNRTLSQTNNFLQQLNEGKNFGIYPFFNLNPDLSRVKAFAAEILNDLADRSSLAFLAAAGVDVISGSGQFCKLPHLAFIVGERRLRSRKYLIATGSAAGGKHSDLLEKIDYLTTSDLWQKDCLNSLSDRLVIIGGTPLALELTQNLAKLGKKITYLEERDRILPREDREISGFVRAILEAEGVQVFTNSPLTQVKSIDGKKWLQAGNRAIETDRVIFAGKRSPNIFDLNLSAVGVKYSAIGIKLDRKLRTTNPRIYACGDVAGGYSLPHLARYEANIAVKNALFFPRFKVDYRHIPITIFTAPPFAKVGITEAQARSRYGKDVFVVREYFKNIAGAQISGEITGFFKCICTNKGKILGANIIGPSAAELIGSIALAMKHNITLNAIASLPHSFASHSEIIDLTAIKWQSQNQFDRSFLQNFLENLFVWQKK